jgi:PIN domain nuclease of toxin-antitoxin system
VRNETAFGYSPIDMVFLDTPKVSTVGHNLINNSDNELFFSAANLWENYHQAEFEKANFPLDGLMLAFCLADSSTMDTMRCR